MRDKPREWWIDNHLRWNLIEGPKLTEGIRVIEKSYADKLEKERDELLKEYHGTNGFEYRKISSHQKKRLSEARANLNSALRQLMDASRNMTDLRAEISSRDVLLDKCEKTLGLIESGESTYYDKSNGVKPCYELAVELLTQLKSRREK